jgi:hypothetical protein
LQIFAEFSHGLLPFQEAASMTIAAGMNTQLDGWIRLRYRPRRRRASRRKQVKDDKKLNFSVTGPW